MPRLPIILHSGSISPDLPGLAQKAGIARFWPSLVARSMLETIRIELAVAFGQGERFFYLSESYMK